MTFYDDKAVAINALVAAVEAIETELGILPAGAYATVRTRLDILETRINNPLAPAPTVLNPFFIGSTGVTIQTNPGDPGLLKVLATPGSLYLREDGYANEGLYAFRPDGYWHLIPTDPFDAAGDLSGTQYTQTVIGIQGYPVKAVAPQTDSAGDGYVLTWNSDGYWEPQIGFFAAGDLSGNKLSQAVIRLQGRSISTSAPTTGNTLSWSGSAWTPSALNLAGGGTFVSGQLPPANMGTITLAGNVSGSNAGGTITATVVAINGTNVPATPSANQVLVATSGVTSIWQQIIDNQVSASAGIQGTKIIPSFGSQNIANTGTLNTTNITATNVTLTGSLLWPSTGTSTPSFGIASVVMPLNATYTVPSTKYNSFILNVSSTASLTATQNVVLPLVAGSTWIVRNNTTGGASIQLIGSSGTGFIIPNGNGAVVWTDGTNFYGA